MSSSADLPPETTAATAKLSSTGDYVHVNLLRTGAAVMKKRSSRKYRPVIDEPPQSHQPIHGRGASWSPANRFEKLHVDLTDVDPSDEEKPRRATQYFRDAT